MADCRRAGGWALLGERSVKWVSAALTLGLLALVFSISPAGASAAVDVVDIAEDDAFNRLADHPFSIVIDGVLLADLDRVEIIVSNEDAPLFDALSEGPVESIATLDVQGDVDVGSPPVIRPDASCDAGEGYGYGYGYGYAYGDEPESGSVTCHFNLALPLFDLGISEGHFALAAHAHAGETEWTSSVVHFSVVDLAPLAFAFILDESFEAPFLADLLLVAVDTDRDTEESSWTFDFGDDSEPAAGTGADLVAGGCLNHTYAGAGPYLATLTVTDADGLTGVAAVSTIDPANSTLAEIVVSPAGAILGAGEEQAFTATGFDVHGNERPLEGVEWSVDDASLGEIDGQGVFTAGEEAGVTTVYAAADDVVGGALVIVGAPDLEPGNVTDLPFDDMELDDGGVPVHRWEAGFHGGVAGGEFRFGPGAELGSAHGRIARDAGRINLIMDLRPGDYLTSTPDEIDAGDLAGRLGGNPPALFLTIHASEDGTDLNSSQLNDLLDWVDVEFSVNASFFEATGLSPMRLYFIEYSDGTVVNAHLAVTLVGLVDGFYHYTVHLDRFSTFAAAVATGGGGGARSPGPFLGLTGDPILPQVTFYFGQTIVDPSIRFTRNPTGLPALPEGLEIVDVFDVGLVESNEYVTGALFHLVLPAGQVPSPTQGVLLHLLGGQWVVEAAPLALHREGDTYVADVTTRCCSVFAVAFDTQAPRVDLGSMPDPAQAAFTVTAAASDNLGIERVEFYVDDVKIQDDSAAPYELPVAPELFESRAHEVKAVAVDAVHNRGDDRGTSTFGSRAGGAQESAGDGAKGSVQAGWLPYAILAGLAIVVGGASFAGWRVSAKRSPKAGKTAGRRKP